MFLLTTLYLICTFKIYLICDLICDLEVPAYIHCLPRWQGQFARILVGNRTINKLSLESLAAGPGSFYLADKNTVAVDR